MTLKEALKNNVVNQQSPTTNNNQTKISLRQSLTNSGVEIQSLDKKKKKSGIIENIGKETVSLVNRIGEGALDIGNTATDALLQVASSKFNPYYKIKPNQLKSNQNVARELIKDTNTEATKKAFGFTPEIQSQLDKGTFFGSNKFAGQVARGVASEATKMVITGGLSNGSLMNGIKIAPFVSAIQGYGGGIESAYNAGVTNRDTANLAGAANAAVEYLTDKIIPGSPGFRNTKEGVKTVGKALKEYGFNVFGEGFEEGLAAILNPIVNEYIYTGNKKDNIVEKGVSGFNKIDVKQVLKDALAGMITGGILDSVQLVNNVKDVNQTTQQKNQTQVDAINQQDISTPNLPSVQEIEQARANVPTPVQTPLQTPENGKIDVVEQQNPRNIFSLEEYAKQYDKYEQYRKDGGNETNNIFEENYQKSLAPLNLEKTNKSLQLEIQDNDIRLGQLQTQNKSTDISDDIKLKNNQEIKKIKKEIAKINNAILSNEQKIQKTELPGQQVEKESQYATSKSVRRIVNTGIFGKEINEDLEKMRYQIEGNPKNYNGFLNKLGKIGYDAYVTQLNNKFNENQRFSAEDGFAYQALAIEAKNRGDSEMTTQILSNIMELGQDGGQFIQSLTWLSKVSPEGKAKSLMGIKEKLNNKIKSSTKKKILTQKSHIQTSQKLASSVDKYLSKKAARDAMLEYKDLIVKKGSNSKLKKQLLDENKIITDFEKILGVKSNFPSKPKSPTTKVALVEVSKMNVTNQKSTIEKIANYAVKELGLTNQEAKIMAEKVNTRYLEHIKANRINALNQKVSGEVTISEETINKILNSKTVEETDVAVQDAITEMSMQIPPTMIERLSFFRQTMMLINPLTHIRNIGSNGVMRQVVKGKDKLRGTIEDIVAKHFIPDMERTSTGTKASADKVAYANEMIDKFKALIEGEKKFELGSGKLTTKQELLPAPLQWLGEKNFKKLSSEDFASSSKTFARSFANAMEANNYTVEFLNSDTPQAQLAKDKLSAIALKNAEEATFRQHSDWADALNRLQRKAGIVSEVGVGGLFPFKKTLVNIAKTGFEYSPAMFAKTFVDLKSGKINANEAINGFAKGTTGTGMMALGGMMAAAGFLNGSDGEPPYSINVFGKTYTVGWLAPALIPFFIGANIYDGINKGTYSKTDINDLNTFMTSFDTFMAPLKDNTILDSVNDVFKNYDYTGETDFFDDIFVKATLGYAGQFIPSIGGAVARTIDPVKRNISGEGTGLNRAYSRFIAQQQSKIPGLSQGLPASYDENGNQQVENNPLTRTIKNFLSPGRLEKKK